MKKKCFISFLAILLISVAFIACGDNADTAKTEGDPNDVTYLQAKSTTEVYVDSLVETLDFAAGYMTFDGVSPLGATADSANVNYDPQTCWWEIYFSSDTLGSSLLFIDSVSFDDGSGCQMFPDSTTTTEIEYRAYASFSITADSGSISFVARENVVLSGIQTAQIVIDGSNAAEMNLSMIIDTTEASFFYDYSGSAVSVTFNKADLQGELPAHPLSGTLNLSLAMEIAGTNGSANVNWTMIVSFLEDHYHVYAESGDNYWEWDVYYDPGPVM